MGLPIEVAVLALTETPRNVGTLLATEARTLNVAGDVVQMSHAVDAVDGDTVKFTTTYTSASWHAPEVSHSTLRFLDAASLSRLLGAAGFVIEAQFGDWHGGPFLDVSPEVITIATPAARWESNGRIKAHSSAPR